MKRNGLIIIALSALVAFATGAESVFGASSVQNSFESLFNDSTLRLDYIFLRSGPSPASIALANRSQTARWHGRVTRLDSLALAGNARLTMTTLSGDTIFRQSFSSLFLEWIETGDSVARAFEHVVLTPAPRQPVRINLELSDNRHDIIATHSFVHNPNDILVRRPVIPDYDTTTVAKGTYGGHRITVTILSEGYTESQRELFLGHSTQTAERILAHEPFKSLSDRFDFIAVFTPSVDEGVSIPRKGQWKNTAFRSHFSTFYSDRYLTCPDIFNLHDRIEGLPAQHIIILANTDEYGGGGIFNSYTLTTALHPDFSPVVVHEFGHSFGGLADEYYYDNDVMTDTYPADIEPWERNITTLVDFIGKWENLLDDSPSGLKEADLIEGAAYSARGIYRSADDCRMKTNTAESFCPACRQALSRLIHFYTDQATSKPALRTASTTSSGL